MSLYLATEGRAGLDADPKLFADEERAMADLGVGKNIVRSIRFWSLATGMVVTEAKGAGASLTELAISVLGKKGVDPFWRIGVPCGSFTGSSHLTFVILYSPGTTYSIAGTSQNSPPAAQSRRSKR